MLQHVQSVIRNEKQSSREHKLPQERCGGRSQHPSLGNISTHLLNGSVLCWLARLPCAQQAARERLGAICQQGLQATPHGLPLAARQCNDRHTIAGQRNRQRLAGCDVSLARNAVVGLEGRERDARHRGHGCCRLPAAGGGDDGRGDRG